jgi:hypothetical protein
MSIYDNPTRILAWYESEAGQEHLQRLAVDHGQCISKLSLSNDVTEIFRLQGELRRLGKEMGIPNDVRQYLKDKMNGKVK